MLLNAQRLGYDEARAAQCRVAACYRGSHHTEYCQCAAEQSEPARRYRSDHLGSLKRERLAQFLCRASVEEIHRDRCPYQRYYAFGYHGSVEQRASLLLAAGTTRHERALCGVESAHRSARNGYEQAREYWSGCRTHVRETVGKFGQRRPFHYQHHHECHSHEEHGDGEEGIYLADDLVDGQQRCEEIVGEDDDAPDVNPRERVAADVAEDERRTVNEHRANHH